MTTLALAGDTMLGRIVDERIAADGPAAIWGSALPLLWSADLLAVNLECALTARRERWRDGHTKAFYFGARPSAVEALHVAGVDFASLANNHVLDFREDGLRDTVATLDAAGIAHAGAGNDRTSAAHVALLEADGLRVGILAFADHPEEWAATESEPGINLLRVSTSPDDFAPLRRALGEARGLADLVVLSLHWGPNMRERPAPEFRAFARAAVDAGADVVWGHSAHVVQGIEFHEGRPILYDTGELIDDYAVDPELRNDLGALFLLRVGRRQVHEVALVPLLIRDMRLERASGADRARFVRRMTSLCEELGTALVPAGDHFVARLPGVAAEVGAEPDGAVLDYPTGAESVAPYAGRMEQERRDEESMEQERRDEEAAEGAEPYFAPTDPVLGTSAAGEIEIRGGFEDTSMDSVEVETSESGEEPGDEALADAVRRELREDATTAHLALHVEARGSVIFLHGKADDLEDADNAAEVASRVPGVRQVVEQIAVAEV